MPLYNSRSKVDANFIHLAKRYKAFSVIGNFDLN